MRRTTVLTLLCLVVAPAPGCAKKPAVTVEQVHDATSPEAGEGPPRLHPPRCRDLPTADYPDIARDERPEQVAVRIDLVIDRQGRPTRLRTTVDPGVVRSEEFAAAARSALERLECKPAVQLPYPGSDHVVPVPVEYASTVIYRFYRDENDARGSF